MTPLLMVQDQARVQIRLVEQISENLQNRDLVTKRSLIM